MVTARLPYTARNPLDLIDVILKQPLKIPDDIDPVLRDLLERLLCKSPKQRIDIAGLRLHPWVQNESDQLPTAGDNVVQIEDPTQDELGHALTPLLSLGAALGAFKAARQLKRLAGRRSLTADLETFHGHREDALLAPELDKHGSIDDSLVDELRSVDLLKIDTTSPAPELKTV